MCGRYGRRADKQRIAEWMQTHNTRDPLTQWRIGHRLELLFVLILIGSAVRSLGQTATLLLYTPYRSGWQEFGEASGLELSLSAPELGRIFDGDQEIARFIPSRYLILHLPVGVHVLSARFNIQHHADKKRLLTVDLKPEGHYFVRFTAKSKDDFGLELDLKEVNCELAEKERARSKQLELKYVASEALKYLRADSVFPQCGPLPNSPSSSH